MAIIKHLKRLGATVRGGATGDICAVDKDGNVIDSGKPAAVSPSRPGSNNIGKFWKATASGSAAWSDAPSDLPEIEEGDEGKFLSVNEHGEAQWAFPTPGSGKYAHYIHVTTPSITDNFVTLIIINSSSAEITSGESLKTALENGGHVSKATSVLASGIIGNAVVRQLITSVYKDEYDAIHFVSYARFDGTNWILSPAEASFSTLTNLTVSDYVVSL